MIPTELHRSCVLEGAPATQGLTRYLVSKDTKVYRLALCMNGGGDLVRCAFTHVPSSRLAGSATYQGCAALGLKGHRPQRLCRMEPWFVVVI